MVKGIHLTLLIGPAYPVPVPESVLDALVSVEVVAAAGNEVSGFELTFTVSNRSPLQTAFLLSSGTAIPLVRVVLVVTLGGTPQVIVDGVMTSHEFRPGDGGHSVLVVRGKDLSVVMDAVDFSGLPYPAMPREARVALVLAKYAALGLVPLVIPSLLLDVPIPTERIPRHQGKDLAYVRKLAEEVGYIFCIEPGPSPGVSFAYWGPEIRVGAAQPALSVNMDFETNVERLEFRFDKSGTSLPVVWVQEPFTKIPLPVPVPSITPLRPPLGLVPPLPTCIEPLPGAAKHSPLAAAAFALGKAAKSSDCVFGNGTLDVLRYGRLLSPRRLVGVRGAGPAFDGLHYVKRVTHKIRRGAYKQDFALARNGLLSTVSQVPA